MGKDIEVRAEVKGDVHILYLKGDVTAVTGGEVEAAYQAVSGQGAVKILIHFDKDGYINSGGIAVLIQIEAMAKKKGQTIRLTGLSDHFKKIFGMVGLTRYTEIHASEEAALKGL